MRGIRGSLTHTEPTEFSFAQRALNVAFDINENVARHFRFLAFFAKGREQRG